MLLPCNCTHTSSTSLLLAALIRVERLESLCLSVMSVSSLLMCSARLIGGAVGRLLYRPCVSME